MAEQTKHYNGLAERDAICKEYEELNKQTGSTWRMLHDNFDDPKWKHGDPFIGTMIFTNELPPAKPLPRDLAAEIDGIKADIKTIKEKIK